MLQREVAERLVAEVGTRGYGSLSALYQSVTRLERLGAVSNSAFDPVPKVESVVVRCTPIHPSPLRTEELDDLESLVRACFGSRRKTLVNSLRAQWPWGAPPERARLEDHMRRMMVDPSARAEVVTPTQFVALIRSLRGDFVA
jgi:16S rRNA (adenine1518-N6/adenine1519-N6)-dimethyltransferase